MTPTTGKWLNKLWHISPYTRELFSPFHFKYTYTYIFIHRHLGGYATNLTMVEFKVGKRTSISL